jgi:ferric-dicitrate binding protein FerR (iron transport regulator)
VQPAEFHNTFLRFLNNNCSQAEAEALMEQLAAGELTPAQQQLLEQQLTNRTALQANGTIHPSLQNKLDTIKQQIDAQLQQETPVVKAKFNWRTIAAAAAVTGLLAGGFWLYQRINAPKAEIYVVEAGEKRSLRLADGTQVLVNGGSELTLSENFNTGNREVILSGEAYFDVAQNTAHPFIIHTASMDIKVLGTAFNVRSYPDEVADETSLIRGKVQVTLKNKSTKQAHDYVLLPMQKLVVNKNQPDNAGVQVAVNQVPHVESLQKNRLTQNLSETAWTENKLAFNNEKLEVVAEKMEKWYGVSIVIKNDALKSIPYTGSFDGETLEKVIETIQYSIPMIHYKMENKSKLILF